MSHERSIINELVVAHCIAFVIELFSTAAAKSANERANADASLPPPSFPPAAGMGCRVTTFIIRGPLLPTYLSLSYLLFLLRSTGLSFFAAVPRSVSMHFVTDTVVAETFL